MEAKPSLNGDDIAALKQELSLDEDDELLSVLEDPDLPKPELDDSEIMHIPGMEKKDGTLYFNGEKVKSIQGPSGQLTVPNLDEAEKYSEDNEIIEDVLGPAKITPVKKLSKIHNIQEILKKLNVKSIKNVKSVKAIKNIEEINDSVAQEFIKKHGLKNIVNGENKGLETYGDPELEKIVDEIETEDIIEATIDKGISKEKDKLDTLEKVKELHVEKKKEKIDEYENLKEIIENNLNAEVGKISAVKSIAPVKSIEEVKSIKPVTTIKGVKKMSPVKSMKEIKNIYDLTEEQADKLRALIENKNAYLRK